MPPEFAPSPGARMVRGNKLCAVPSHPYQWQPQTNCAAVHTFNGKQRPVVCDMPTLVMGVPLVKNVGNTV